MITDEIQKRLLDSWQDLQSTGEGESCLMFIKELLQLAPNQVELFVSMFEEEQNPIWKELLADIILRVKKSQPAIDYLKSLGEDDFRGYAGFPED